MGYNPITPEFETGYSIKQMEDNMTIFYTKRTGDIKNIASGIQDMSFFGVDAEDFSAIWDYAVLPKEDYVLNNLKLFRFDSQTSSLKLVQSENPLSKYM
jgi:hypothetical protein